MDPGGLKFWAFISYSHRDGKVASAVQRALESYRLPSRLVGRPTPFGPAPRSLKPVFRDREELQASADLDATVREALAQSRYLIVLCSPDAARSAWVNREIVEFKKLHGESRVLALIVAGEPFASRVPGREAEECFPEALRFSLAPEGEPRGPELEPMAADLRPGGDGMRLAMLKLVAGMLGGGVGLDELVRREGRRQLRRLATIATASIAGMLVMAVLAAMAIHSRGEAQSRRAQAEDLIEFMLGDLRKRLDPVGRLDALDAVGEKALAYYAEQDADELDAAALGQRSRAMHLIGEIRERRGQLDEALAAFRGAARTTAQLLSRSPEDPKRIFDHAQSVFWVGNVAWRRGQATEAERAFLEYRELAQRLVRIDAANPEWQLETAYASQNLGIVQLERNQLDAALRSFSDARDVFSRLLAQRPAVAFELADAYGWIAKVREASGRYRDGIDAQQARIEVLRAIPDAAKNTKVQRQVANARFELARLKLYLGDARAAEPDARASAEQAAALVAADASNMFWLSESCFNRLRLAEVELALGRTDAARSLVERVEADAARLLAKDASALNWQVNLHGQVLVQKANVARADGRPPPAGELDAYLAKVAQFEGSGRKLSGIQAEVVARAELAAGDLADRDGNPEGARARWNAAASRLQTASLDNYSVVTLLAQLRVRLGDLEEARRLAARVEASNYRHPAYAGLVNELAEATRGGRFITGRS